MYTIKRKPRLQDKLRLQDGDKILEIAVDLDVDTAISNYWRMYEKLYMAQETLKKDPSEVNQQEFGNAFLALLSFLFGDESAAQIVAFYDGRYSELLLDLYPYLENEIYPKLKRASAERAKRLRSVPR